MKDRPIPRPSMDYPPIVRIMPYVGLVIFVVVTLVGWWLR